MILEQADNFLDRGIWRVVQRLGPVHVITVEPVPTLEIHLGPPRFIPKEPEDHSEEQDAAAGWWNPPWRVIARLVQCGQVMEVWPWGGDASTSIKVRFSPDNTEGFVYDLAEAIEEACNWSLVGEPRPAPTKSAHTPPR